MLELKDVTLAIVDCVEPTRAIKAINHCRKDIKFNKILFFTSCADFAHDDDITIINSPKIDSIMAYSAFMVSKLGYYIETSHVLTIQWDAYILNSDAWTNEFLKYDYIGAPWWFDDRNVGNGAFSLRSKKFLTESQKLGEIIGNIHPEDLVLCRTYRNHLEKAGIIFAPEEVAHKFSFEGNKKYGVHWNGQFGFHDIELTNLSNYKPKRTFHKIYRISESKIKCDFVTKKQCFQNFIEKFGTDNLYIIADNTTDETNKYLELQGVNLYKTNTGNSGSLKHAFEIAKTFDDDDIVYFVEDDFLHLDNPESYLRDGLQFGRYVTTYDHPDKFIKNGPNPLINGGEDTKIFLGQLSHWRITNSTVQTFACYVKTLKEDWDILHKHNFTGKTPDSFKTFIELGKEGKRVVVSIPGRSTHCHSQWLSPLKDWSLETGNIKIWMTEGEVNLIKKYLKPNMTMLEYGSGGSTLEFSKLVKEYISVEHDYEWYLKIKKELNNRNLNNVDYHYVPNDLPRSYPHTKEEEFRSYIDLPWTFPNPYHYDAVLIDGRARNWGAEYIRDLLNSQAIVFIHDWDRPKYHEVLQWYKIIDQCDKLVALQVK